MFERGRLANLDPDWENIMFMAQLSLFGILDWQQHVVCHQVVGVIASMSVVSKQQQNR